MPAPTLETKLEFCATNAEKRFRKSTYTLTKPKPPSRNSTSSHNPNRNPMHPLIAKGIQPPPPLLEPFSLFPILHLNYPPRIQHLSVEQSLVLNNQEWYEISLTKNYSFRLDTPATTVTNEVIGRPTTSPMSAPLVEKLPLVTAPIRPSAPLPNP